jgi:hypothetical protein
VLSPRLSRWAQGRLMPPRVLLPVAEARRGSCLLLLQEA